MNYTLVLYPKWYKQFITKNKAGLYRIRRADRGRVRALLKLEKERKVKDE